MSGTGRDSYTQHAFGVPYDPDNDPDCDLVSDNAQEAIDELCGKVAISASPGFTWGKSGNIPSNTWLLNDTVPSNKAGRRNFLNNAKIVKLFVSNENVNTFDLGVYEHLGSGTEVLLTTVSIVAARAADFTLTQAITTGKELAIRVTSGSAKNIQVGLIIKGSL